MKIFILNVSSQDIIQQSLSLHINELQIMINDAISHKNFLYIKKNEVDQNQKNICVYYFCMEFKTCIWCDFWGMTRRLRLNAYFGCTIGWEKFFTSLSFLMFKQIQIYKNEAKLQFKVRQYKTLSFVLPNPNQLYKTKR